jgi:hypothetical protein
MWAILHKSAVRANSAALRVEDMTSGPALAGPDDPNAAAVGLCQDNCQALTSLKRIAE